MKATFRKSGLRFAPRALAALTLLALSGVPAQAQSYDYEGRERIDNPDSGYGGVGGGLDVTGSGTGGTSVSMSAQGRIVGLIDGRQTFDRHIVAYVDGRTHYNTVGVSGTGATTGFKADTQVTVGYTPADAYKIKGCDVYFGASGSLALGGHRNLNGSDRLIGYAGLETGPICYLNEAVLMLSPTVQIGGTRCSGPRPTSRSAAIGGSTPTYAACTIRTTPGSPSGPGSRRT